MPAFQPRSEGEELNWNYRFLTGRGLRSLSPQPPTCSEQVEPRFHTVQSGDTLSKIAREVYGDPNAYMTIFTANQPVLVGQPAARFQLRPQHQISG